MKGVFTRLRMDMAKDFVGIEAVERYVLLQFDICDKPVA
jgi:hypothetical protein